MRVELNIKEKESMLEQITDFFNSIAKECSENGAILQEGSLCKLATNSKFNFECPYLRYAQCRYPEKSK